MIAAFRRRHRNRVNRIGLQSKPGPCEWYTPAWVIELARDTLGTIDLDPSSDETAQSVVKAAQSFGVGRPDADGGLSPAATWAGRVWMNPPYGRLFQSFIGRLITEVDAGHVEAALVLTSVPSMSSASAGQPLMQASVAACVLQGRLTFWGPNNLGATPTFGSVVTGLGDVDLPSLREGLESVRYRHDRPAALRAPKPFRHAEVWPRPRTSLRELPSDRGGARPRARCRFGY